MVGYQGSAHNFRHLEDEQKAVWHINNRRGRRSPVWTPGEYLVIDRAEVISGLLLFCAVPAFSRWRFDRFAVDEKAFTSMAMIAEVFEAIGRVPAKVLADRMSCLKGGGVTNVVAPTLDYIQFASHYWPDPDRLITTNSTVHSEICLIPAQRLVEERLALRAFWSAPPTRTFTQPLTPVRGVRAAPVRRKPRQIASSR